jgi:hypothetical protein
VSLTVQLSGGRTYCEGQDQAGMLTPAPDFDHWIGDAAHWGSGTLVVVAGDTIYRVQLVLGFGHEGGKGTGQGDR